MLYSPLQQNQGMHIPDGFLSIPVSVVLWVISITVITIALKRTRDKLSERQIPLMGVMAAAIFAGQMLNYAIPGGTSGHMLGAALAVILLGPWPATLIMTAVVSVQALIFQDGGLLTLGANLFNMAFLAVWVSSAVYTIIKNGFQKFQISTSLAGFLSGWTSIVVASLGCSLQLVFSNTTQANLILPAMTLVHGLIGIGEGLITVGALALIKSNRLGLQTLDTTKQGWLSILPGVLVTIFLVGLTPFASRLPDGLEWVAEKYQFTAYTFKPFIQIIPDYSLNWIKHPGIATILAGLLGTIIVAFLLIALLRTKSRPETE